MRKQLLIALGCVIAMQVCCLVYAGDDKECGKCDKKMEQAMEKKHQKHLDKMAKDLNLTADQKDKVAAIMKEAGESRKAEMKQARENAKAKMEATDKKIEAVLTPDQVQKFEKMKADRKAKMEKKMKKCHSHGEDE